MNLADPTRTPVVVVAVDDAEPVPDAASLRFAVAEARARGASLRLVHGCATVSPAGILGDYVTEERVRYGERVLEATSQVLHGLTGGTLAVTRVNSRELGSDALLAESGDAVLLVTEHSLSAVRGRLTRGSTLTTVAGQARCPMAVVPVDRAVSAAPPGVVVAVDGRGHSRSLVREAAAEAARRGVPLTAVLAWGMPPDATAGPGSVPAETATRDLAEEGAARSLAESLMDLGTAFPQVVILSRLVQGPAADVLVDLSRHADLLVVGRHGEPREGPTGLGRVTRALISNARCPLLVAPPGPNVFPWSR